MGTLKVGDGAGVVKAHLDGIHDEIRAAEGGLAVKGLGDMSLAVGGLVNVAQNLVRLIQVASGRCQKGRHRTRPVQG